MLYLRLSSGQDAVWAAADAVRMSSNASIAALGALARGFEAKLVVVGGQGSEAPSSDRRLSGGSERAGTAGGGAGNAGDASGPSLGLTLSTSNYLTSCRAKRHSTESMVKVVEQHILRTKRHASANGGGDSVHGRQSFGAGSHVDSDSAACCLGLPGSELVLSELIGAGGFGSVWRGSWKNITAAIKVMYERGTEQEAMMDAVEMAVLSTVSHPNIIQVYTCLTDMVEVGGSPGACPDLLALLTCMLSIPFRG